jgi:hypothetical protein
MAVTDGDLGGRLAPVIASPGLSAVRLADGGGADGFYYSERDTKADSRLRNDTRIMLRTPQNGPEHPIFTLRQLFATDPAWDLTRTPDGTFWVAFLYQEGAGEALMLQNSADFKTELPGLEPSAYFLHPRFARRAAKDNHPVLTAVAGSKTLLYFRSIEGMYFGGRRLMDACDGLMVEHGATLLLLYTVSAMGPIPAPGVCRGVLHAVGLNENFEPHGPTLKPFGDTHIFEFDAASLSGHLAIFATSDHGPILTLGKPHGSVFETEGTMTGVNTSVLTQPTILAADGRLRVAALESDSNGHRKALAATIPIVEILGAHR